MGTIAKVTAGGATHLIASTAYATCPTGASTAAKVATIQDSQAFTLIDGVTVHVYFTYSNTAANPTLNVNSTGAKSIYKFGSTAAGTTEVDSWPAGSVVSFTYNKNGASGGCWTINNFQKQTAQVNSDWTATTGTSSILNKPTIPAAQVNSNWTATTGVASILNKPSIPSTYSDVGAASAAHTHTYSEVGAASASHTHTPASIGAMSAGGVSINRKVSTGTNIADITINGTTTSLYAPTGGGGGVTPLYVYVDDSTTDYTQVAAALSDNRPVYAIWSSPTEDTGQTIILKLIRYNAVDYEYYFSAIYGGYGGQKLYWACLDSAGWEDAFIISIPQGQRTFYGTSSTTASTAEKAVTISGFTSSDFDAGTIVGILFTTANTAATPTLNINSLGARAIYIGNSTLNSTTNVLKWSANTMLYFMYNGAYFRYMYASAAANATQPRGANTWYGTSSTAAATQAKTSTIENFVLTKGALITINFSTANSYNGLITLNINSTGAKNIYYKNAVTSSTNKPLWKANSTITFVYDSSYYHIINITPLPTDQIPNADEISFIPRAQQWQDPLYDQTLGETIGSSLENSLNFTYHSIIQVYNDTSQTIDVEEGVMAFVPFNTIYYKNDVDGVFSLDSTGGIKVSQAGYYRVAGNLLGYTNSNAITSSSQGNYRRGLYIFVGTSPNTANCTEWVSHVEYSPNGVAFGITPQIIYANQNDIIYLVFRPLGQAGKYNPGMLRQSFLNVERLPNPYPAS